MTNLFGFDVDGAISAMGDKFARFNGGNNPFGAAGPQAGSAFGMASPSGGNPFGAGATGGGNPFTSAAPTAGNAFQASGPQGGNAFAATGPQGGNAFQAAGPQGGNAFGVALPQGGNPFGATSPVPIAAPRVTVSNPASTATSGGPSAGMTPGVAKWAAQTQQVFADIAGLDPDTMLAIMTNESGGDPNAYNPNAPGGAWGLFQNVGLGSNDPQAQFAAAHSLAQQKTAAINATYAANGLNPDARTRARDFALAWAGHFDYGTGQPNPNSRDAGSGQTAEQLTAVFLKNYDAIKGGRTQAATPGNPKINGDWIQKAQSVLGMPYTNEGIRASGNPADSFDCSSLVGWALGLPRNLWNAQAQYDNTQRVDASQLQPGDLVFFQGTNPDDPSARPVTHVGIYTGNHQMINAQTGGVMVADLNSPYWQQHLFGYGRVQ